MLGIVLQFGPDHLFLHFSFLLTCITEITVGVIAF